MATCKIYGYIINGSEQPIEGVIVYAVPAILPEVTSTGLYAFHYTPITTLTTSSGYFELNLSKGLEFFVYINSIGFRQKITTPSTDTAVLFSLASVQTQDIATSTG